MNYRFITEKNLKLASRVADPVHFRPNPDPVNQNFKNRICRLLALTKNKFKLQFFFINQISSDIYVFPLKNGKIHLKMCKRSVFLQKFLCVYKLSRTRIR